MSFDALRLLQQDLSDIREFCSGAVPKTIESSDEDNLAELISRKLGFDDCIIMKNWNLMSVNPGPALATSVWEK